MTQLNFINGVLQPEPRVVIFVTGDDEWALCAVKNEAMRLGYGYDKYKIVRRDGNICLVERLTKPFI